MSPLAQNTLQKSIIEADNALKKGGIIAYPTEAVYGLGVDPFNKKAVHKLLKIKNRDVNKGLILIAANFDQLKPFIHNLPDIPPKKLNDALETWPGPVTWIFPASPNVPQWITGDHEGVALRVTNHPIAKALCEKFSAPIVSTSANIAGEKPARSASDVRDIFGNQINLIIEGETGREIGPTEIRDLKTGKILRDS